MYSQNIQVLRGAHSWSFKEMSRKSGVSVGTLHRIEKHPFEKTADPRLSTLGKIAQAFSLPSAVYLLIDQSWIRPWLKDDESVQKGSTMELTQHAASIPQELSDLPADRMAVARLVAAQGAPVSACERVAQSDWAVGE